MVAHKNLEGESDCTRKGYYIERLLYIRKVYCNTKGYYIEERLSIDVYVYRIV